MRICRMLGWEGDVSLAGDNGQTLARVCRGLSVGRRLCCAPSTLPGLVPISPSEGTRWGQTLLPWILATHHQHRGTGGGRHPPSRCPQVRGGCRGTPWGRRRCCFHPGTVPPLGRLSRTAQGRCRRMLLGQEQHPWAQRCGVPSLSSSSRWQPTRGPVGSVGWVPGVPQPRTRGSGAGQGWSGAELVSWWPWWSCLSHTP